VRPLALVILLSSACPVVALAGTVPPETVNLAGHWVGYAAFGIFIAAYALVMTEEFTGLRKSKPVILAAGLIWALIAWSCHRLNLPGVAEAVRRDLLDYAELLLFLLVAMTYINAMEERRVFDALRAWLIRKGFGFRTLFWLTGFLAFFISPVADNMTTALLMCAVVLSVGGEDQRFVLLACINIVVAANAGGAFSPFGDITTLMVWQKGVVQFWQFFHLFVPALVNFLVPALIMHLAISPQKPVGSSEAVTVRTGGLTIIGLFLATILTAVAFHNFLDLPPVIGMLTGLGYLQVLGYYLTRRAEHNGRILHDGKPRNGQMGDIVPFDVFRSVANAEWDTLLFFYGVVLCVGALGFIGYLAIASQVMYTDFGPTPANITIGLLSAIVDNIPVMFAVLTMNPDMSTGQWLLVTMTAGVGGSLFSIGSAAGVALMGQAHGRYTFFGHLKWTPAVAAGYAASIVVHMWLNARLF
jgi:NhaD family Na+/H+ antiporter